VRLNEKGGKPRAVLCHYNLETYLVAYIEGAGLGELGVYDLLPEQGGRDTGAVRTGTSCKGTSEICRSGTHTMAGKFGPIYRSRKPLQIEPCQAIDLYGHSPLQFAGPENN
jgi:hypothetical protein